MFLLSFCDVGLVFLFGITCGINLQKWIEKRYAEKDRLRIAFLEQTMRSAITRLSTTPHKEAWNDAREVAEWFKAALAPATTQAGEK